MVHYISHPSRHRHLQANVLKNQLVNRFAAKDWGKFLLNYRHAKMIKRGRRRRIRSSQTSKWERNGVLSKYLGLPSTQCDVDPLCVSPCCQPIHLRVMVVQWVPSYEPISTCLNPVWCWSIVCVHRAVVNLFTCMWWWSSEFLHKSLFQCASTQCGFDPICVSIGLLSTYSPACDGGPVSSFIRAYFNMPQPSVVLIQFLSP